MIELGLQPLLFFAEFGELAVVGGVLLHEEFRRAELAFLAGDDVFDLGVFLLLFEVYFCIPLYMY